jgi:uncharacterized protein YqgC (DUF456 family)
MWDWVAVGLLSLACLLGVILTAVRLPGTWLIVLAGGLCGWLTQWQRVTVTILLVLVGVAVAGEAIELLGSMITAKKAGASRQAAWGGLLGGFLGMFLFSIPVPIIGTIVGAILGCFCGALIGEYLARKKLDQSTKVGFLSAVGFVLGMAAKLTIAFALSAVLLTSVVCSGPSRQDASPAKTALELDRSAGAGAPSFPKEMVGDGSAFKKSNSE